MLAAKRHEVSKTEADKGKAVMRKPEESPPAPINPIWQRLATHVPGVQAKLKIGQPGDQYEQEADRVAEQVMRMPEPNIRRKPSRPFANGPRCGDEELVQTKPLVRQITPLVQRQVGLGAEEDLVQLKLTENTMQRQEEEPKDEEVEPIQGKSADSSGKTSAQTAGYPLIKSVLSSLGRPLDAGTRSFMEPRFGQDFSGVRVHVGGAAAKSAQAVNARAYTVGRNVVFGEGQYMPGSSEGQRLVAHELVHVVQQNNRIIRREVGPGKGPEKTASGIDALKSLKVLQTAKSIRVPGGALGDVELIPGANINGKILLYPAPLYVYYIDGTDVWEAYTPDFVRGIWISAFVQGVSRAEWLVPLIKAEFALIEGFLAPWYVMLGLTVLEAVVFYDENKVQIKQAAIALKALNDVRVEFKKRYPVLYNKILYKAITDSVIAMKDGVGLDDVAYFIGRVLGTQGLLGKHMAGVTITLKVITKILAEYAILITVLHGPKMIGVGLQAATKSSGEKLQKVLADAGINVSKEDAIKIITELAADPESKKFLEDLGVKAKNASNLLNKLMSIKDKAEKQK